MENNNDLISMEDAIDLLKTTRPTFYRWLRSGRIKGLKVGRQWRFYPTDLERFMHGEQPRIDLPADISLVLATLKEKLLQLGGHPAPTDIEGVDLAINLILRVAMTLKAETLFLEPIYLQGQPTQIVLRMRIDGHVQTLLSADRRLLPPLLEQWKMLSGCDLHTLGQPQEGQFDIDYVGFDTYEIRTVFLHGTLGESMSARLINRTKVNQVSLRQLELPAAIYEDMCHALNQGWGMVVTSGPTGSGKTTTLYAALNQVASPTRYSVALEDPVESLFPWVNSIPVQTRKGQTFSALLRLALQTDPDVLMIGELRDQETLDMALRIALTGHLVLTQMHTTDAVKALFRLIQSSGNVYSVVESVRLILNQRLVRRLCPHCRHQGQLDAIHQESLQKLAHKWGLSLDLSVPVWLAKGCQECHAGYRGRLQLTEALKIDHQICQLLLSGSSEDEIYQYLTTIGWQPILADGLQRAQAGDTSLEEVLRVQGLMA